MSFVAELDPQPLWRHFDAILEIPRGSKNEAKIRDYVVGVADRLGLSHEIDAVGNLVVRKAGSAGHEKSPATVLQGHLDMVNEKNSDVTHDFDVDPLVPRRDGEWLTATGTTLGADNGIGLAAMLALMEATDVAHGPLEFLYTIDEETGLTGASALEGSLLQGRRLLNLDSEEEGVLTIGCAGGADTLLHLPLRTTAPVAGAAALRVRLFGLKGGHSGVDIHRQRGNATKLLARALHAALLEAPVLLSDLEGGTKHNSVPREAWATVVQAGSAEDLERSRSRLAEELEAIRHEFRRADPDIRFELTRTDAPASAWDAATTARVLTLIEALPHGVMAMSQDIAGLVETSTNVAVVAPAGGKLKIWMSSRSSSATALEALRRRIRAAGALAGAEIEEEPGYPGWQPNVDSRLLGIVKARHEVLFGKLPEVGAVHAGLECGIIGEKCPGMDMISFGPQIEFPHSPDERVKVDTVGRCYELLKATLEELA